MLSNRVARCIHYQGNMMETMLFQKGFSIQPSVLLLVYTTSRDGGCSCAVSGTMTSAKLLHPITLPEGQPHVLESRGYDEAPTFAVCVGGWLSVPPWTTGQCWWTKPTWTKKTWTTMASGRPIGDGRLHEQLLFCWLQWMDDLWPQILDEWRLMVTSNCA